MEKIMFIAIAFIIVYVVLYRKNKGEKFSSYVTEQVGALYDKYAPYSFKEVRSKVKELGQEYTTKQYALQVAIFGIGFSQLFVKKTRKISCGKISNSRSGFDGGALVVIFFNKC